MYTRSRFLCKKRIYKSHCICSLLSLKKMYILYLLRTYISSIFLFIFDSMLDDLFIVSLPLLTIHCAFIFNIMYNMTMTNKYKNNASNKPKYASS